MDNPYRTKPDWAFWSRAVAGRPVADVDPVVAPAFTLLPEDRIATAGSCFAQHISRTLVADGRKYLITEDGPVERHYGVFPARFGNIYTTRQLLQLFQRAYALFRPIDVAWTRDGAFVDPFRPTVEPGGFESIEALTDDRRRHLAAVREMFETCDVFIFTLGLTESWRSLRDGATFPLAPGVSGAPQEMSDYGFHNLTVPEMIEDLSEFIACLRTVNPNCKVLLTVSPVPLVATYTNRHVLAATTLSKSALRVVADVVSELDGVGYFPSYEVITGPQAKGSFYADDLRSVTEQGVATVMDLFRRHYLQTPASPGEPDLARRDTAAAKDGSSPSGADEAQAVLEIEALADVVCDELEIER